MIIDIPTTLFVVFRIASMAASVFYEIVKTTNTYYTNELKSKYENKNTFYHGILTIWFPLNYL